MHSAHRRLLAYPLIMLTALAASAGPALAEGDDEECGAVHVRARNLREASASLERELRESLEARGCEVVRRSGEADHVLSIKVSTTTVAT